MDLIQKLKDHEIIKFGNFTLKSGQQSNIYVDLRQVIGYQDLLKEVCYELSKVIQKPNDCVICGVPLGGLPYACQISSICNLPMIMTRDKIKTYGLQNIIEGNTFGKECVVIEDVITTGGSVLESLELLEKEGVKVREVVAILDRECGGLEMLRNKGYIVNTLYKLSDFNQTIEQTVIPKNKNRVMRKLYEIQQEKKTNLIFSADITDPKKLIKAIVKVAPYVCAIKLHIDSINFKTYDFDIFVDNISILKRSYNFLVIEDRKYSDIASTVSKQFDIISRLADIVTAYGITGPDMLTVLEDKGVGVLLIYELSSKNNLIDKTYSCKIKDMAEQFKNIIGFICQGKVSDGYFNCSPGVKLNLDSNNSNLTDMRGQQYNTPETMKNRGTNTFIVGRGIYESKDIEKTAKLYRDMCW
jgi:uridine monophosphate synthetase